MKKALAIVLLAAAMFGTVCQAAPAPQTHAIVADGNWLDFILWAWQNCPDLDLASAYHYWIAQGSPSVK